MFWIDNESGRQSHQTFLTDGIQGVREIVMNYLQVFTLNNWKGEDFTDIKRTKGLR